MLGIGIDISTIGKGIVLNTAVEQGSLIKTLKFEAMLCKSVAIAAVRVYE